MMSVPVIPRRHCADTSPHVAHIDRIDGSEYLCGGVSPRSEAALTRWRASLGLVRDYGLEAHQAADAHLTAVWNHFYGAMELEMTAGGEPLGDDPAVGPFCGCQTCEVREVLAAAWPIIQEGVANGDLTLDDIKRAGAHD